MHKANINKRKRELNSNTGIARDFNALTSMDRSSRQKISKKTLALSDTLDCVGHSVVPDSL